MTNRSSRASRACNHLAQEVGYDKVINTYETREYVEIRVTMGGDTLLFRVYNDGMITER